MASFTPQNGDTVAVSTLQTANLKSAFKNDTVLVPDGKGGTTTLAVASQLPDLSQDAGNLAFIDALLQFLDFMDQNDQLSSAATITISTAFQDVPGFAEISLAVPVTKRYKLRVDFGYFVTAATDRFDWRVLIDGVAATGLIPTMRFFQNTTSQHTRHSWLLGVTLTAGTHKLRLQMKGLGTTAVVNTDASDALTWTIWT